MTAAFRFRRYGRTDCRAYGSTQYSTVAPAHFVTDSRPGCPAESTAYGGIQRGIPRVDQRAEQDG
jgi:hypothetical protein